MPKTVPVEVVIVTGMSGAGKSTAIDALADLGFYCVDNLPVPLLPSLLETVATGTRPPRIAVGIDARSLEHLAHFSDICEQLRAEGHQVEILFFEAPEMTILRRFSETRRRHPLGDLPGAIEREVAFLAPLRALATASIDTDGITRSELRGMLRERYAVEGALTLVLTSFGYKNGMPREADVVFDVRFLKNPFDLPALRPLSGFDEPVAEYVLAQEDASILLDHFESMIRFQAPRSMREGRSHLTVAIGCTGGQHRSVAMVEALIRRLRDAPEPELHRVALSVRHRDVDRGLKHA